MKICKKEIYFYVPVSSFAADIDKLIENIGDYQDFVDKLDNMFFLSAMSELKSKFLYELIKKSKLMKDVHGKYLLLTLDVNAFDSIKEVEAKINDDILENM